MKINFPINNDRDYFVVAMILAPDLFCPDYISFEARELYNSLTEDEKNEIKNYCDRMNRKD